MQRLSGFTLIELMITLAVIAILTAIAYPSYQDYIRRGVRAHGQQYLLDLAQREEQFFLDQRTYTTVAAVSLPPELQGKYQPAVIALIAGPPPGFRIALAPVAGSIVGADGALIVDNLQNRWRSVNPADTIFSSGTDCRWEDSRCTPS